MLRGQRSDVLQDLSCLSTVPDDRIGSSHGIDVQLDSVFASKRTDDRCRIRGSTHYVLQLVNSLWSALVECIHYPLAVTDRGMVIAVLPDAPCVSETGFAPDVVRIHLQPLNSSGPQAQLKRFFLFRIPMGTRAYHVDQIVTVVSVQDDGLCVYRLATMHT
jgi:hypothetical protein